MRSIFISLLAVISPLLGMSQAADPIVINSAGFNLPMQNSSFTLSLGEPAIITLTSTSSAITQGFLQPINLPPCSSVSFSYFPNPAKDMITIAAVGCDNQIESVQIIDIWGRILTTTVPNSDNQINLAEISQGLYVLKIAMKGGVSGSVSVIKTSN